MTVIARRPNEPTKQSPDSRGSRRKWALAFVAVSLIVGFAVWLVTGIQRQFVHPAPSKLILDRHDHYLGEVPGEDGAFGYWPVPAVLPERIVVATIETEDRHFREHGGVRTSSILRAAWQNLKHRRVVSGASTIAMQVARMQSPGRRSFLRKIKEAIEAKLLIRDHGHDAVLRQYLSLAPYGNRVHGVVRAARLYFDKPLEDLSWLQAAFLAGLPQMPGRMSPYEPAGLERGLKRARKILKTLNERGFISNEELTQAIESDLGVVPRPHRAPEAIHAVLAWSEAAAAREGPILTATLDLDVQTQVAEALERNLSSLDGSDAGDSAALVVDSTTGDILAWVGSQDYFSEEDKGAIDYVRTKRSPGSALKPFIYALAVERGDLTAATEIADTPMDVQTDARAFLPENVNHLFYGPVLARQALGNSRNIPALRVLSQVGIEPALRFFERAGVRGISHEPDRYGLGLAIGNLPVTLEELVSLYGVLARNGETLSLRRFADDPPAIETRVLDPDAAALVTNILSDPEARQPSFAAGGPLDFDYAVAVKTGTSQGHRDSWTVAFSDRLIVGVWVGNHDARRMNHITGSTGAAPAVHAIMDAVMPTRAPYRPVATHFRLPPEFVTRTICPLSGQLAGPDCPHRKMEVFIPGTQPVETCHFHARVPIDRRNGLRATTHCDRSFVEERSMLDLPEIYSAWARQQHLEVAPHRFSPWCPGTDDDRVSVSITEPHNRGRYLWDPDTPAEYSTIRLAADVHPTTEPIVWIVDGQPIAEVGYPYELRWPLKPGEHRIQASFARRQEASKTVTVLVEN
jgi:penicillin-binding protein 1C